MKEHPPMATALPALNLIAEPGRRRAALDAAREIERRGFAGISVSSSFATCRKASASRWQRHLPRVRSYRVSDSKIAARCPDVPRDQVKCRQTPDYHDFTMSSVFSATDQPLTRSALLLQIGAADLTLVEPRASASAAISRGTR
jgi:hypothetical protein